MSDSRHRASGSSRRPADDELSRAQRTAILEPQDRFLGRPVRGFPDSRSRAPSVVSGAFAAFAATATLSSSQVILRSPERTYPFALSPRPRAYHATAASFGLDALLLPALSSRHQRGAADTSNQRMPPKRFSTSLHPCSRRSRDGRSRLRFARETRLFTQASLLWRDRSISFVEVFARRRRLRSSPLTSPS